MLLINNSIFQRKERQEKERDYRHTAVVRSLVWRYISAKQRQAEENSVTEDDINEVKGEISSLKCQLLEVLEINGMDVSSADTKKEGNIIYLHRLIQSRFSII